jgi:putative Mn2+ efflux pump MntP
LTGEKCVLEKIVESLLLQGLATSIDALSVGFAMADSGLGDAVMESCVIGLVTFALCMAGVRIGRRIGVRLADKASILGGIILIAVGLRILLSRS